MKQEDLATASLYFTFFSPGEESYKEDLATASERLFRSSEKLKRLNALRLDGIRFLTLFFTSTFHAFQLMSHPYSIVHFLETASFVKRKAKKAILALKTKHRSKERSDCV
jgi:hypothetical protein